MRKGFTLIELLVVIAIIAILAAILFPVFGKAREKARQTHCTNNQKSFATAVQIYTQEHDETFPAKETFWGDIRVDKSALKCMTMPSIANGYVVNKKISKKGIGEMVKNGMIVDPTTVFLTADGVTVTAGKQANICWKMDDFDYRHNDKVIASFLDGHVEMRDLAGMKGQAEGSAPNGTYLPTYNDAYDLDTGGNEVTIRVLDSTGTTVVPPSEYTIVGSSPYTDPQITFNEVKTYKIEMTIVDPDATNPAPVTATFKVLPTFCTTEADMAGLGFWLHAGAIKGLANLADVTTWPASYPAGGTCTKNAVAGTVKYVADFGNGKPAVRFDSTGMRTPYASTGINDNTIIVVYKLSYTSQWSHMMAKGSSFRIVRPYYGAGNPYKTWFTLDVNQGGSYGMDLTQNEITTLQSPGQYAVLRVKTTPSKVLDGTFNGVTRAVTNVGNYSASYLNGTLWLNAQTDGTQSGTNRADIAEVIWYERAITDAEITAINTYIKTKYGL